MKLDIVKHKFIYLAFSAILLIPGIIAMVYSMITYNTHTPVKVGIDYTGGTTLQYGVKEVIWRLNLAQRNYIEDSLHFVVEPYLYKVKTRRFYNISNLPSVLKDIHYQNRKGVKEYITKLSFSDKKILEDFGVNYVPYKYKIKF